MKKVTEVEFDKQTYFSSCDGDYKDKLIPGITLKTNDMELINNIVEFFKTRLSYSVVNGKYDDCITSAEAINSIEKS